MEPTDFDILLIDDNPGDAKLIQLAFAQCPLAKLRVSVLAESRDAINYLHHTGKFTDAPTPDIVLLDYHMPIDGGIALSEIKGNPDFQQIPVIVLTGSSNPRDVEDVYRRHANCCFLKRSNVDDLLELSCDIVKLWLLKAMLPPKQKGRFTSPLN
ncbi:MAG: response regulator [Terracidiphilus sp.]